MLEVAAALLGGALDARHHRTRPRLRARHGAAVGPRQGGGAGDHRPIVADVQQVQLFEAGMAAGEGLERIEESLFPFLVGEIRRRLGQMQELIRQLAIRTQYYSSSLEP